MKKNLILAIVLLAVLAVLSLIFSLFHPQKQTVKNGEGTPITLNGELVDKTTFETRVLKIDDPYVKFEIKYPHFLYISKDFNDGIKKFVQREAEAHRVASRENWLARYETQTEGDNIGAVPANDDEKFYFFADFEIIQSNSEYISLTLNYGGFSGGAHGYENKASLAYDVANKRYMELKDLFTDDNSNYLMPLSVKARNSLKSQLIETLKESDSNTDQESLKNYTDNIVSMIELGTEPKEENFVTYTFTPDKIKIYFAQYQVGPYAIGMPEVEIDR